MAERKREVACSQAEEAEARPSRRDQWEDGRCEGAGSDPLTCLRPFDSGRPTVCRSGPAKAVGEDQEHDTPPGRCVGRARSGSEVGEVSWQEGAKWIDFLSILVRHLKGVARATPCFFLAGFNVARSRGLACFQMSHVRIAGYRVRVPASSALRIAGGVVLIAGGVFGILPVLGYWMIPAGLVLLSFDFPLIRRFRRRMEVYMLRGWRRRKDRKRESRKSRENGGE